MTDEIRAIYVMGALGLVANGISFGASLIISRRANNLKDVARHEQNFALLKGPAEEKWGVDISLADKR